MGTPVETPALTGQPLLLRSRPHDQCGPFNGRLTPRDPSTRRHGPLSEGMLTRPAVWQTDPTPSLAQDPVAYGQAAALTKRAWAQATSAEFGSRARCSYRSARRQTCSSGAAPRTPACQDRVAFRLQTPQGRGPLTKDVPRGVPQRMPSGVPSPVVKGVRQLFLQQGQLCQCCISYIPFDLTWLVRL